MPGRFTELVCAVSARLSGAAGDRIALEVRAALEAIREFVAADQCAILRIVDARGAVVMLHRVAIDGVPPAPTNFDYGQSFPLTYRTVVVAKKPFILDRWADLPANEHVQRETCQVLGMDA